LLLKLKKFQTSPFTFVAIHIYKRIKSNLIFIKLQTLPALTNSSESLPSSNDQPDANLQANTDTHPLTTLPTSITWPLDEATNEAYDLNDSSTDNSTPAPSPATTSERLSEAKLKYTGYLTRPKLSPRSGLDSSQYLGSDESAIRMDRIDKSYQVNLADLKPNMIDHQTQMTPPLSPLKNVRIDQFELTDEEEKEEVSRVSIGTETEDRQKPVQAATTQTGSEGGAAEEAEEEVKAALDESGSSEEEGGMKLNAVSMPIVKENIRRALVRDGKSGVDTELNDEQCLILLQGMKKMDDDFKSELKNRRRWRRRVAWSRRRSLRFRMPRWTLTWNHCSMKRKILILE